MSNKYYQLEAYESGDIPLISHHGQSKEVSVVMDDHTPDHCVLGKWRRRLPLTSLLLLAVIIMFWSLSRLSNRIERYLNGRSDVKSYYDIHDVCIPGTFRDTSQLRSFSWELPVHATNGNSLRIPMYWTRPIDVVHSDIKQVVIIQHGNLRNANEYFCGALSSIQELRKAEGSHNYLHNGEKLDSVLIVAPHFLIEGDIAWESGSHNNPIMVSAENTAGFVLWTSEGWKDGGKPINSNAPDNLFSYDIFNLLIDHFSNRSAFPQVEEIVLFGFSAGGQTILRYSMWPTFVSIPGVRVRSVVGDMSTYLYLNAKRPFTNNSEGFGIPNKDWIPQRWNIDHTNGKEWIVNWNDNCEKYNNWRYGLEELNGYFQYHSSQIAEFSSELVRLFPHRFIDYLVGLNDSINCNLISKSPNNIATVHTNACNDNELATYCQAMLQGENRFDRFIKWKQYLEDMFDPLFVNDTGLNSRPNMYSFKIRGTNSAYYLVKNVSHDAVQMLRSKAAKCVVFGHCDVID